MRQLHKRLAAGALAAGAIGCPPVLAQESDARDNGTEPVLEEIIVRATKRAESVQDIPISATVFSGQDLVDIGAFGMQDIASRSPSLKFGNRTDLKIGGTTLRGIGRLTGASAANEEAVAYYVDEVYVGGGVGANLDLFDLERVEVLRGPQGTLFGRNSVGGAINITTNKPVPETKGYIDASYGNYDAVRIQGAFNKPLSDRLYGRVAADYYDREGYTENLFSQEDGDTANSKAVRAQLRMLPTGDADDMEFNISASYRDVDQSSKFFETLRYDPDSLLALGLGLNGIPQDTDPYDRAVNANEPGKETLEAWSLAVHGLVRLGDLDLNTITAYRTHDYFNRGDTDMTPLDWSFDGDPEDVWRFSQEIRLTSNYQGRFNWIAGVYYLRQKATNLSVLGLGAHEEAILGIPAIAFGSDADTELDSISGFVSFNYRLRDNVEVSLGGRYTYEEKLIDYRQEDPFGLAGGTFSLNGEDDWGAFTPSVSARYFVNDDVMIYGTVSRGYKSGGFNDALGSGANISFDPEFVWSYEGGIKTAWLENRVIANVAVFEMDWTDIQFSQDNAATPAIFDPVTGNAAESHSRGVEAEFSALPTDSLKLGINGSIVEAEFDEGILPAPGGGIPLGDIPSSPEYTLNLNAEYRIPVNDGAGLTVVGEYIRQGDVEYSTTNNPIGHVEAVGVWNARLHYENANDRWALTLWGRNLGDEDVVERVFELFSNPFIGKDFIVLAPPRTYGISARFNF